MGRQGGQLQSDAIVQPALTTAGAQETQKGCRLGIRKCQCWTPAFQAITPQALGGQSQSDVSSLWQPWIEQWLTV